MATLEERIGRVLSNKRKDKKNKNKKYERNLTKCARYRSRVGKPRGRGVPGNKRGKNR